MKLYAIFLLLFIVSGCRSSRSTTDTHISDHSTQKGMSVKNETISLQSSMLTTTRTATDTRIKEYFRTTLFNPDGSVSEVQEAWRDTGRTELADSTGRSSDDTLITRSDSTVTETNTDIVASEKRQSETDSRLVQGWKESGAIALIAGILLFILMKRISK